jgi:hypothetical protein
MEGSCREERPCQLTMCIVMVGKSKLFLSLPLDALKKCGNSLWGPCDYGCTQVRIKSVAHSDGICHEESPRESRPCHIGACARSQSMPRPLPCSHCLWLSLGVNYLTLDSRWSALLGSLASAAQDMRRQMNITEAGDVNVFCAASPGTRRTTAIRRPQTVGLTIKLTRIFGHEGGSRDFNLRHSIRHPGCGDRRRLNNTPDGPGAKHASKFRIQLQCWTGRSSMTLVQLFTSAKKG